MYLELIFKADFLPFLSLSKKEIPYSLIAIQ